MAQQPKLTFFVELASPALVALCTDDVIATLAHRHAGVAMALLDLDPARAALIRRLQAAGIPVTAWLLLPLADGYWLTADNAHLALAQWQRVAQWAVDEQLELPAVGLDIEPPHDDLVGLVHAPAATLLRLWRNRRSQRSCSQALGHVAAVVEAIRQSGRQVEAYHLPIIADEPANGHTLARLFGTLRCPVDREVLMLYRSAVPRAIGRGLVAAYGAGAQAIAVGITGGGVRSVQADFAPRELDGAAVVAELRLAAQFCPELCVFSLEGCVARGILATVCQADLRQNHALARRHKALAQTVRAGVRNALALAQWRMRAR